MASIKVKFRPSSISGHEGTVYYQIIHERIVKIISSDYKIKSEEWDVKTSSIFIPANSLRFNYLRSVKERIRWDMERVNRIILQLSIGSSSYSVDDIISEFEKIRDAQSVFNYIEARIITLKANGKIRTSETYRTALNCFKKFRNDEDIQFDEMTSELMESYEAYLSGNGLIPNSISFHMRILRAIYNRAVEDGITEERHSFKRVYTGIDKTRKRALCLSVIRKINEINLKYDSSASFARDIFMLSFFFRGMSFIDMAYLRKTDLQNGFITYRRRKTGQQLTIRWTKEMQQILDKYPKNQTKYLLPIITDGNIDSHAQYRSKQYKVNKGLKIVGDKIGLNVPLTAYVARHSWASIAKFKGIPISIISDGLGHNNELTTQIYLSTLDTSAVDKANALILKSL